MPRIPNHALIRVRRYLPAELHRIATIARNSTTPQYFQDDTAVLYHALLEFEHTLHENANRHNPFTVELINAHGELK